MCKFFLSFTCFFFVFLYFCFLWENEWWTWFHFKSGTSKFRCVHSAESEPPIHWAHRSPHPWFIVDVKVHDLCDLDSTIRCLWDFRFPRCHGWRGHAGLAGLAHSEHPLHHGTGAHIVTWFTAPLAFPDFFHLFHLLLLLLIPPRPVESWHGAWFKCAFVNQTAAPWIVPDSTTVGAVVLSLDDGLVGLDWDQAEWYLGSGTGPLVVTLDATERAGSCLPPDFLSDASHCCVLSVECFLCCK